MQLPLDQAIPRFKENEDRIDTFVNDELEVGYYVSSGYVNVETLPAFIARKDSELDSLIAGATDEAEAFADAAEASATAAADSAAAADASYSQAATQASTATTQAGLALTRANAAASSASAASSSATSASNSASAASASASAASASASTATTQATNASNSATSASGFASSASSSATDAENAQIAAEASEDAAAGFASAASASVVAAGANAATAQTAADDALTYRNQAESFAASAEASADAADISATAANGSAVEAFNSAEMAENFYLSMSAFSQFAGFYETYADFSAVVSGLDDGVYAVLVDESHLGSPFSIYSVESGVDTFLTSLVDGGSLVNWGAIGGSIEDQTDLQAVFTGINDRLEDLEYGASIVDSEQKLSGYKAKRKIVTASEYILENTDTGYVIEYTFDGPISVVIPEDLDEGFLLTNVVMSTDGQIFYSTSGGATLVNRQGHTKSQTQYSFTTLYCSSNEYENSAFVILGGDTASDET